MKLRDTCLQSRSMVSGYFALIRITFKQFYLIKFLVLVLIFSFF